MNFAEKYKNEPIVFWEILFTDERKFEIFSVKKPPKIWQSVNEEFNDKRVAKTIKHGGGSESGDTWQHRGWVIRYL